MPLLPGDLFFSYWTEHSSIGHPSRKTAYVFKNPENAGIVRTATAPYFYGSILLRALKSEIIVLLTYEQKK